MNSFIKYQELEITEDCKKNLHDLYEQIKAHNFNLLGSGNVIVDYELNPKGFHNKKYNTNQMKMYGKAINRLLSSQDKEYVPINWFVDYKTGFFYNPLIYHNKENCLRTIGQYPGVDIKTVWELGRLYHLVPLAIYASISDKLIQKGIIKEYYCEMLDFIQNNPIGRTVQWSCPMDVAIRIVNVLISFDILKQLDNEKIITEKFEKKLTKFIRYSCRYVLDNIEYGGKRSSNHYLSNIVGIAFGAAYLPASEETDAWLVFAVQEMIEQVKVQFYEEGSNFEGSTSYHRLSTELVLYATSLVYGVIGTNRKDVFSNYNKDKVIRLKELKKQKYNIHSKYFFPKWYLKRLCNAGKFTKSVLKSNNEIVQIGDNDSGRLIKLTPMGNKTKENVLDHRTLLSSVSGLFENDIFERYRIELPLESSMIRSLSNHQIIKMKQDDFYITCYGVLPDLNYEYKKKNLLFSDKNLETKSLLENIAVEYYSKFGLLVLKSDRVFLSMVIDTLKYQKSYERHAHTHNDKMSIELMVDKQYITRDPGTYIYTAVPKVRDKFRSTMAHNCIHVDMKEQNIFTTIFDIKKLSKGELLYYGENIIVGKAIYQGIEHIRKIEIFEHQIIVTDYANKPFKVFFKNKIYSAGYGELERI